LIRVTVITAMAIAAAGIGLASPAHSDPGGAHADSDDVGMIKLGHMMPLSPVSQENAIRSAKEYLNLQGFSRQGLIRQLVSFDNYSTDDATAAVDSIPVNWNEQAARSAKEYLSLQGFSHSGLVNQLIQFDGYTPSQAEYGTTAVGL
jgi:hypothetical protein